MQTPARNFRNELVTAVIALVMLGTAVGLAAVLTGGPGAESGAETPTAISVAPTEAPTLPPTETPTASATLPPTAPPTATPTATPTVIEVTVTTPPTSTPTATDEPPTAPPSTSAPTDTPAPTLPPTETPRPTRTPVPRLVATSAPLPSATATQRPTSTPRPTHTPPPTVTQPPTATQRPAATHIPTSTPTATATIVLVTPITPTVYNCTPPPDWRPYTIRPGDNLFRISLRAGLPLQEIQRVNCIPNAASIEAGTVLYVPPTFFYNSSAPTSGSTSDTTSSIPRTSGCSATGSQITSPSAGAVVSGRFTVVGSATLGNRNAEFNFYKLELRSEDSEAYINAHQATAPVIQGVLGTINTASFGEGTYELKLTVVDETGNYIEPCAIRLIFR
ncbi:MAG: LysM peptidoglycan-binding domain-containing protein [Anaerolineae bacterium]|nr:LysM peptidoglycan-binding domain-containing protein [Anaerolineae bacterium]